MNDTHHSNNAPAPASDTAPLQRPARTIRAARKQRGAQPGNQNARKHGVYSALNPAEHAEEALLNTLRSSNLWPHIDAMRNAVFALLEDPAAPQTLVHSAVTVLRGMVKVEKKRRLRR